MGKKKGIGVSDVLGLFTVFDYVSPIVNTADDIVNGNLFNMSVAVNRTELNSAARFLRSKGIQTGSQDMTAFSRYGTLTLADDKDYNNAVKFLSENGYDIK